MSSPYSFAIASRLNAPAERVWSQASTFAGVNRELRPLVCMTYPARCAALTPETVPLGRVAFRSWLLLFGFLPVEYDDVTLVELEPSRGFSEVSPMLSVREWRHRRTVTPQGAASCVLRDDLALTPRWPLLGPVQTSLFRLVFALRHRALRNRFGGGPAAP
jgi:ligand-binding SRPBCC domain-containing protein